VGGDAWQRPQALPGLVLVTTAPRAFGHSEGVPATGFWLPHPAGQGPKQLDFSPNLKPSTNKNITLIAKLQFIPKLHTYYALNIF
jgi:hypothetical protein